VAEDLYSSLPQEIGYVSRAGLVMVNDFAGHDAVRNVFQTAIERAKERGL
jgi:hypothetical protein